MKHTVFIGLGTNLGDRYRNLSQAKTALNQIGKIVAESAIYKTPPWGYTDQPAFLNEVVKFETNLAPEDLLKNLKLIEERLGREESFRYGPRIIDLDILFYDNIVYNSGRLTIPHKQIAHRAFVLVPLADLAPDMVHPTVGKTISEMLFDLEDDNIKQIENYIVEGGSSS